MQEIKNLVDTLEILEKAVRERNQEKSFEAVTVFLLQFMGVFGHDQEVVRDTFPTMEGLKNQITAKNYDTAHVQVLALLAWLREAMSLSSSDPLGEQPIDLSFRPKSYFWPLGLERHVLTRIKGSSRRAALQRLVDAGQLDDIPDFLAKEDLSEEERRAIGSLHPMFMGAEYLPDKQADEVEIARIEIKSTTGDVTSVYAKRRSSGIHYRVVDEYDGATLTGVCERVSAGPLSLGELVDFFLGAWPFMDVLEMNFEQDVEQMLDFFRGVSNFYPDLDRLLRQRVIAAYPGSDH